MTRFSFFIAFILSSLTIVAQETDSLKNQNKGFLRIHFLIPGVDYEKPFTNNFTCKIGLMSGVAYGETIGGWDFTTYISAEQRYYFSLKKRRNIPNREKYFSNLYLSLQENYFFESNDFVFGPVIGYQFTCARIWYFDFGLGAGYQTTNQEFSILSTGNFCIGLILDFFN